MRVGFLPTGFSLLAHMSFVYLFVCTWVPNMAIIVVIHFILPISDSGGVLEICNTPSIYFFLCLLDYVEDSLCLIYSPLNEGATSSVVNIQLCFSWLVELESSAIVRLVQWSLAWITWNYHHTHWYYHLKGEITLMRLSPLACDSYLMFAWPINWD